ncbi:MAG TPA: ABC transporter permease [Gemmataceae bacterium]|nr:ABC transporter permease [Gemmataceae bacterium]
MKYLAILKDSMREAIDTKVFYALAVLSLLVVVIVGSTSYTAVDAETAFQSIVEQGVFHTIYADKGNSPIPHGSDEQYRVRDVKALTQASEPSGCDHSFTLVVAESAPYGFHDTVQFWASKADIRGKRRRYGSDGEITARVSDAEMTEFLKYQFWMAGNLDIVEIKKTAAVEPDSKAKLSGSYTFEVKTKGHAGVRGWRHDVSLLFGLLTLPPALFQTTLSKSVFYIENTLFGGFGAWVAILVGVIITAFFIPNMLRKGTIDMLLAKPIHRGTLLIYKYIGGLTFVFLSSAIAIGSSWLVLGLRSGIWSPGFLVMIFVVTFFFAILYSISTLFGVLTRSPIVAILATCMIWFVLFLLGLAYQGVSALKKEEMVVKEMEENGWGWVFTTSDVVHFVLPRTSDLDVLSAKMLAQVLTEGERKSARLDLLPDVTWGESLGASFVFIAIMLGLATWRFSRKDY